ncbi:hypothetical protein U9M48_002087 [Paspalum notatum var. saurae]|uniref:Uncharacterized protein n=1 Tax=Paspalum notatum var. saurae TaxID=547442 RepID=A0AAQ3SIS9_PASNO
MVKNLIGGMHPLTLKLFAMFNGLIDSRGVQRGSSSHSLGGSSSHQHCTTSDMEIESMKQEIQRRDAFLKAQEEYQRQQQAHQDNIPATGVDVCHARSYTATSTATVGNQSGHNTDFVNNLFASEGSDHNSNEPGPM